MLYGQTLDTNASFISEKLSSSGYKVINRITVGDDAGDIAWGLDTVSPKSTIILLTGGLGPTRDDITKNTLSGYFGSRLILNENALKDVEEFFRRRGVPLSEVNRRQALLPEGSRMIRNSVGTAPGMWFEKEGKTYISMPGVPHEMEHMLVEEVIPKLVEKYPPPAIRHQILMTAGIGESLLAEQLTDWENNLPSNMKLAYLPGFGQVKLRLTGWGEDYSQLENQVQEESAKIKEIAGRYIYADEEAGLEKKIGEILRTEKKSLALAESCTGGHLAHTVTTVPGSSDYFLGGIVAYNDRIKRDMLGVNPDTLMKYGAVSEETVREMASGIRKRFGSSIGISVSGIAGPGGGSLDKPVGLVWIALEDDQGTVTRKYDFVKDRVTHIHFTTVSALTLLWQRLKQIHGIK